MQNILKTHSSNVTLKDRLAASIAFTDKSDVVGKTTLNIGCGFGWFERVLLSLGAKKTVGTDISAESISIAQSELKNKDIQFSVGSATQLDFPDNTFDAVFCWEVIEHIPKDTEQKMFDEVHRVLKKGGVFYVSTPHDDLRSKLLDPAWWLIGHRHYSIEKLHSFFGKKFRLKKHMVKGGWWWTFSLLNMYVSKWLFHRSMFLEGFFQERTDREYKDFDGWANIFIKVQKK